MAMSRSAAVPHAVEEKKPVLPRNTAIPKEASKESVKESVKETPKKTPKEAPKEAPKETSKEKKVDVSSTVPRSSKKRNAAMESEGTNKRVDVDKTKEQGTTYDEENSCQTQ